MKTYWWQDKIDDYQQWHSLLVRVNPEAVNDDAPALLSGHNSRMQLQLRGYPLFWATVLRDHCGVWLIYNQDHPAQQNLLSPLCRQKNKPRSGAVTSPVICRSALPRCLRPESGCCAR